MRQTKTRRISMEQKLLRQYAQGDKLIYSKVRAIKHFRNNRNIPKKPFSNLHAQNHKYLQLYPQIKSNLFEHKSQAISNQLPKLNTNLITIQIDNPINKPSYLNHAVAKHTDSKNFTDLSLSRAIQHINKVKQKHKLANINTKTLNVQITKENLRQRPPYRIVQPQMQDLLQSNNLNPNEEVLVLKKHKKSKLVFVYKNRRRIYESQTQRKVQRRVQRSVNEQLLLSPWTKQMQQDDIFLLSKKK